MPSAHTPPRIKGASTSMFTTTAPRPTTSEFAPTDEQLAALELFRTGEDLIIEAGAGAGKTSTLLLLANDVPEKRGQYVAFNAGIVKDASRKMPRHVGVNTIHSLAIKGLDPALRGRLDSRRMKGWEIAQRLGIYGGQRFGQKNLSKSLLASYATKMVHEFCKSADQEITVRHLPYINGIDMPDPETGRRTYFNNRELAQYLLPFARKVWEDSLDPEGGLPYSHGFYLKRWELNDPQIGVDFLLVDEAQDLSPVLLSIIQKQRDTQIVLVGDSAQQIYEFTGAVNAMANSPIQTRTYLTKSFRFGQAVADVANRQLAKVDTPLRITGFEEIPSTVGRVADPDVILTRTNAVAMKHFLRLLDEGKAAHIVGGGKELVAFARAAIQLREDGWTSYGDLQCFNSWQEVLEYVAEDEQGDDLALSVKIIEEFTPEVIIEKVGSMPPARNADVTICTAHKSKGLEWPTVMLAEDFPSGEKDVSASEHRLLYVAVTRAKLALDITAVGVLR